MDELIDRLGEAFRGLWKSRSIQVDGELGYDEWTVTFVYRGHYVETPPFSLPRDALIWARIALEEDAKQKS